MKVLPQLVISLFMAVNAAGQQHEALENKEKVIRMDPSNAYGGNASELLESVIYIPLESTKQSTFGHIKQLEVTENYFIIFDDNTNCILLFSRDGKFHCKIEGGNDKVDYLKRIKQFAVNRWKKEIVFQTSSMDTWFIYNFDGKKLKELSAKGSEQPSNFKYITENKLISDNGASTSTDKLKFTYNISFFKGLKEKYKEILPRYPSELQYTSNDMLVAANGPFYNYGVDTAFFYTKSYDYNIYKVTAEKAEILYHFIFPMANAVPADFISNPQFNEKRVKYFETNNDKIFVLSNCYQIGDNLFFRANNYTPDNKDRDLIYNLKTGKLIAYGRIATDEISYYLPIAEGADYANGGLAACDGKYVYTDMSSLDIFNAHEANMDKKNSYDKVLSGYFSKSSKRNNPVILQIKFKSEL